MLRHTLAHLAEPLHPKIAQVIEADFSPHLPPSLDLLKHNEEFLQRYHDSAVHVQMALYTRHALKPESKTENCKDMIRTLAIDGSSLDDAHKGLDLLTEWKADERFRNDYIEAARARWPECSRFAEKKKE